MSRFGYYGGGMGSFTLPPVLKFILISNIVVFVFQYLFTQSLTFGDHSISAWFDGIFALQPVYGPVTEKSPFFFLPTQLLTYQFMHGGFWHLFSNMLWLYFFGAEAEREWGSKNFAIVYLLSGMVAGLFHLVFSMNPLIGASGSVYGILIAYTFMYPNRQIMIFPIFFPIAIKWIMAFKVAIDVFGAVNPDPGSNIGHWAHLGGAFAGLILYRFGNQIGVFNWFDSIASKFKSKGKTSNFNDYYSSGQNYSYSFKTQEKKQARWVKQEETNYQSEPMSQKSFSINGEEINQAKIDEILDKINESGYQNLTEKEKTILLELSKKL